MEVQLVKKAIIKPNVGDIIVFERETSCHYLLVFDLENGMYSLMNLYNCEFDFSSDEIEDVIENVNGGLYTVYPSSMFKIVAK